MNPEDVVLLKKWIEQGANWPEFNVTTLELPPLTDDLTFLRLVTLGTVGVPLSEAEIRAFLDDTSKDCRLNVTGVMPPLPPRHQKAE